MKSYFVAILVVTLGFTDVSLASAPVYCRALTDGQDSAVSNAMKASGGNLSDLQKLPTTTQRALLDLLSQPKLVDSANSKGCQIDSAKGNQLCQQTVECVALDDQTADYVKTAYNSKVAAVNSKAFPGEQTIPMATSINVINGKNVVNFLNAYQGKLDWKVSTVTCQASGNICPLPQDCNSDITVSSKTGQVASDNDHSPVRPGGPGQQVDPHGLFLPAPAVPGTSAAPAQ